MTNEDLAGSGNQVQQASSVTAARVCRWCDLEGMPDWSPDANCWIHRGKTLDKRCLNPPKESVWTAMIKTFSIMEAAGIHTPEQLAERLSQIQLRAIAPHEHATVPPSEDR